MDAKDANDLFQGSLVGDVAARDDLIVGCMPLVKRLARRYVEKHRDCEHLSDDLGSAGYLAVVEAVNSLIVDHRTVVDVLPYVSEAIKHAFSPTVQRDKNVAPRKMETVQKHRELGIETPPCKNFSDTDVDEHELVAKSTEAADKLLDRIYDCCQTDFDRDVVRLRSEGNSDAEVARSLSCSASKVARARAAIESRFYGVEMPLIDVEHDTSTSSAASEACYQLAV